MSDDTTIDTVLLDLGGVLIDWNPRYLYRPLFRGDEAAMEHFLAEVCPPEWNRELDAGRSFDEGIAERQRLFPEHAALIALWKTGWERMLREPIHETVELVDALRGRGHRLYALTNWSAETFPVARARYAFLSWFRDIVVSGEVGLAKPDRRIFELTIDRCGLTPGSTIYVDDVRSNVDVARRLGLNALHFENPRKLRVDLEQLNLL
ncbi:MAG TPA: HAD family phosphatase [Burkholderiales bacterium]|nr:HAD family phosphatase [Burkholderiales bacterium]